MVLECDHLRDKSFAIGHALHGYTWQAMLDEMEKRDVVCRTATGVARPDDEA